MYGRPSWIYTLIKISNNKRTSRPIQLHRFRLGGTHWRRRHNSRTWSKGEQSFASIGWRRTLAWTRNRSAPREVSHTSPKRVSVISLDTVRAREGLCDANVRVPRWNLASTHVSTRIYSDSSRKRLRPHPYLISTPSQAFSHPFTSSYIGTHPV